jgi:DNA polymerase I
LFVVDVGEDRIHAEPSLRLWGVDDDHRILTVLNCLRPYFYFVPTHDNYLTSIQDSISKTFPKDQVTIKYMKRLGRPVKALKISCPDYNALNECVKHVRKISVQGEMFEDDLRLPVRYTTDLEVMPSAWLQVEAEPVVMAQVESDRIYATAKEPRSIKLATPTLRMMAFSILTVGARGSAKPDRDPIRSIAVATDDKQPELRLAENDDKHLLTWFVQKVRSVDPDILVGFNNREQWLYLLERCRESKVKLNVGRDSSEPHTSSYGHISIAGRATLDLLDYANGIADLKVKELGYLAAYLHVPSADAIQFIDDLELASLWAQEDGRRKLTRNASGKALACFQLGKLTLTYAIQLSALTRLPLDQVMTAAVGFRVDSYLLRYAHLKGELIPRRSEQPFFPFRGAIVLEPQPGLHENIVVLDFTSMYPNLMRNYNLSPDTLLSPNEKVPHDEVFVIPEVKHRFRRSPDGLYRLALSNLLTERATIQTELSRLDSESSRYKELAEREKAIKVIANACYGYAGWTGARWYVREVAESATALGRVTITKTVSKANELGLQVICGDTDSIFVQNDPEKIGRLLEWAKIDLDLEVRPARVYLRILFTEAMKRYAGLMEDGSLDIVGLEVVRGDWSEVARHVQEDVLVSVLRNKSTEEAIGKVKSTIEKLKRSEVRVIDLAIRKGLTKPVDEYAVRTPHVEVAKKLLKEGWKLGPGDQVAYVIVKGPGKLYEKAEPYPRVSPSQIDVEYYAENQIKPAAMRILSVLGVKERQLED